MRSGNLKTAITVGVVGYPNVGKSSVINSLRRAKAAPVSSQPGFTKVIQEIEIESQIKILDSPGIVFASSEKNDAKMVLRNVIKLESLEDPFTPVEGIFKAVEPSLIFSKYGIEGADIQ